MAIPNRLDERPNPWDQVSAILARITPPEFALREFDVTQFGAVGDGATDSIDAFRRAIDACHESGGGRVVVPPGTYLLNGPIYLRSNVNLHVQANATVLFGTNPEDYLVGDASKGGGVLVRWEGTRCYNYSPLIYAAVWLEPHLGAGERERLREGIARAARYLYQAHRPGEVNNRGAVWCAVMCLAGLFLGEPKYIKAAQEAFEEVRGLITEDGQVLEGGGPDPHYSFTALIYVYLYRVWSGDDSLDAGLIAALRWFARWHTPAGYPLVGMSSRKRSPLPLGFPDLMGAMERFALEEPYFRALIERYLAHVDRYPRGRGGGHGASPFIWAVLEHGQGDRSSGDLCRVGSQTTHAFAEPGELTKSDAPPWYRSFTQEYRADSVRYVIVKRRYQTAITFRGNMGLHGLQSWAWEDEPPIISPGMMTGSAVRAWGVDSAEMPVSSFPRSADKAHVIWGKEGDVRIVSMRQGALWTHFVFTQVTTLVALTCSEERQVTTWCSNLRFLPEPRLEESALRFGALEGRLHFWGEPPSVRQVCPADGEYRDHVALAHFERRGPLSLFALGDSTFSWGEVDERERVIPFADGGGRYELRLGEAPSMYAWPVDGSWDRLADVTVHPPDEGSAKAGRVGRRSGVSRS